MGAMRSVTTLVDSRPMAGAAVDGFEFDNRRKIDPGIRRMHAARFGARAEWVFWLGADGGNDG